MRFALILLTLVSTAGVFFASAPQDIQPTAEQKAIQFLAREVPRWRADHDCYSCHNNGDAARALYLAVKQNYAVPSESLRTTNDWLARPERWDDNGGNGVFDDRTLARIQFANALLSARQAGLSGDHNALLRAGDLVAEDQSSDGSWRLDASNSIGSPATYGRFLTTWAARQVLTAADVPTKHVERAAEALGREVAEDEKLVVEPPGVNEALAPTLYLGMDGTGVPVRKEELVDRPGKQPDGSAKTREVKLVTIWSAEGRDKQGTPVRDAGSISYSAAIESAAHKDTDATPSEFAARVQREATRRGLERAARQAVLGDGAKRIWNLADEHFPDAVQIVDRFHAKQHLSDVGKSIYGPGSDLAKQWSRERHDELDAGEIEAILNALRVHSPKDDEARKCVDYVERNRVAHALPGVPGSRALHFDWRR